MIRTETPPQGKPPGQFTFRQSSGKHQYIASVPYRLKGRAVLARILLLGVIFNGVLFGQKSEQPGTSDTEFAKRIAQATRVERAPRLDGRLADPVWQQPSPITYFRQSNPSEAPPPPARPKLRI